MAIVLSRRRFRKATRLVVDLPRSTLLSTHRPLLRFTGPEISSARRKLTED